jgi:uncharacterized repeat protein (TIGR02543 family)
MDGDTVLSALTKNVTRGSTVDRPPTNPDKDDYIFHNWYEDGGLTATFDFDMPITENTTVYAGWSGEEFAGRLINNVFDATDASEWAAAVSDIKNGGNDKNYVINVTDDFSVMGSTAATFGNASGITVSLRGAAYQGYVYRRYGRTMSLGSFGSILRTGSNQTIIIRDLTLRGHDSNIDSLVDVSSGTFTMYGGKISGNRGNSGGGVYIGGNGTFTMYDGKISGNTAGNYGGGVNIGGSGIFTMYGGEISGNTAGNYGGVEYAAWGGGVYVDRGTFRIVAGTIYGSDEAENVKNTASVGGASLYLYNGTAQYGTFSGGTWTPNGSLSSSNNDTILVLNGVLQPYLNSVRANGFPTLTTTQLALTFSGGAITGLSADDIQLSGVSGVSKGQLSGTWPRYTLPISGFTESGTLNVSVSKTGYTIGSPQKTVPVYYYSNIPQIEMVPIPAGTFTMGSPATETSRQAVETQHEVELSGFTMSKYQVTQIQYDAVMGENPSHFSFSGDGHTIVAELDTADFPVERVSWYDALIFCNKMSMNEGLSPAYRINDSTDPTDWGTVPTSSNATWNAVQIVEGSTGYRLPTEAQWEYACRAETTTAYNLGDEWSDDWGWYVFNSDSGSGRRTHEVGLKLANAWGLYDMHGNIQEWCWDWYGTYASEVQTDPAGAVSGSNRVVRGGRFDLNSHYSRSARRESVAPSARNSVTGFRVVLPNEK